MITNDNKLNEELVRRVALARSAYDIARESLFEAYLNQLRSNYTSGSEEVRGQLISNLEKVVDSKVLTSKMPKLSKPSPSVSPLENFDPVQARIIRLGSGLSQVELANILGTCSRTILRYENGQVDPTKQGYQESKFGLEYLKWLENKGYSFGGKNKDD